MSACATPALPTQGPSALPTPAAPSATTAQLTATLPPTSAPPVTLLPDLDSTSFRLPPTLQHAWPGGATLFFVTEEEITPAVLIARGDSDSWQIAGRAPSERRFLITLAGLVPGESYRIAIGVDGGSGEFRAPSFQGGEWGPLNLRVPPEAPLSVRLIVLGDSGYGDDVTRRMALAAAELAPDALIHLGDIVYRAEEEGSPESAYARKFYLALEPLLESGPVYPVLGNHELDGPGFEGGQPFYETAFPLLPEWCCGDEASPDRREWYRVQWGAWELLFLNSQAFYGHGDRAGQEGWLERRLGEASPGAAIPVMHIAPFSSGLHTSDGAPLRAAWHPQFEAARVLLALAGHDHNYERFLVDGVTYVVSGGGSQVLYAQHEAMEGLARFEAVSHFLVMDLTPGSVEVTAISEAGAVLDTFILP